MNVLRMLLLLAVACAFTACSSGSKKQKKGSARMYDGDESPHIRMYTEEEGPGSSLHN